MPSSIEVQAVVRRILKEARAHRGGSPSQNFRQALNAALSTEERDAVWGEVASSLAQVTNPEGMGYLAVWMGSAVESGMDPKPFIPPLWSSFLRMMEDGVRLDDSHHARGLELLGRGLVAHLARAPSLRNELAQNAGVLDRLEELSPRSVGIHWVLELLRKCSGTLHVLHGQASVGVTVSYENLSNCFHLFTLLQLALQAVMPGASKVESETIDSALGLPRDNVKDAAWWHYGQPCVPRAELGASIWGESSPRSIASVDGVQVLLLWPPLLGRRSWDQGFFRPFLEAAPPSVRLTAQMGDAEVQRWRSRLGLPDAAPPTRRWWAFWSNG
ncbi:MAG: hypothetical protein ACFB9M_12435 [Myxococcota bacterium]